MGRPRRDTQHDVRAWPSIPTAQFVYFNVRNVDYDGYKRQVENEYYFEDGGKIVDGQVLRTGKQQGRASDGAERQGHTRWQLAELYRRVPGGRSEHGQRQRRGSALRLRARALDEQFVSPGPQVPFNAKAGGFAGNSDAQEHFERLHEIMSKGVGVPDDARVRRRPVARRLIRKSERHTGDFADEANTLLKDPNRAGFEVPDVKDV